MRSFINTAVGSLTLPHLRQYLYLRWVMFMSLYMWPWKRHWIYFIIHILILLDQFIFVVYPWNSKRTPCTWTDSCLAYGIGFTWPKGQCKINSDW